MRKKLHEESRQLRETPTPLSSSVTVNNSSKPVAEDKGCQVTAINNTTSDQMKTPSIESIHSPIPSPSLKQNQVRSSSLLTQKSNVPFPQDTVRADFLYDAN